MSATGSTECLESIFTRLQSIRKENRLQSWSMAPATYYGAVEGYVQESVDALHHAFATLHGIREANKMTVTIAQHWREEGIAIGKAEGMTEGEAKGQIKSVLLILESRFGEIPAATQKRLMRLRDARRIEKTIKQAATCQSLKEFQKVL